MFARILLYVGSLVAIATTGVSFVSRANGPCLSSPAAKPSAWIYDISLSFNAPSNERG